MSNDPLTRDMSSQSPAPSPTLMQRLILLLTWRQTGDDSDDEMQFEIPDQERIFDKRLRLRQLIHFDQMVPFLIQKGILSEFRVSLIENASPDATGRAKELLKHICNPDMTRLQLHAFVECLMETGHTEAAALISPGVDTDSFGSMSPTASQSLPHTGVPHLLVKRTNRPFTDSRCYKMSSRVRGHFIIINNYTFEGKYKPRLGSDRDARRMTEVGKELGFEVDARSDLTVSQMYDLLFQTAADPRLATHDALFVLIMSHGEFDSVKGSDGMDLAIPEVRKIFDGENCPLLNAKPKVFIFVACRGPYYDGPEDLVGKTCSDILSIKPPHEKSTESRSPIARQLSNRQVDDMLTAYSTCPGFVSHRNQEEGSYYISSLVRCLIEHSCDMHLEDILKEVDREMKQTVIDGEYRQTTGFEWNGFSKLVSNLRSLHPRD